jgi:ketosteroid isomerase-like protein
MSSTLEIGKKYVALCKEGKNDVILDELFTKDTVSVEAGAPPGQDRTAKGLDAIRAKSKWWRENHTVHKAEVFGPYPHDDRFAVRFVYDVTNKPSNQRFTMDEVALFTVANGKIVKEEFFYTMG